MRCRRRCGESYMTRLIFVLALMGSLAAAAQAEGVENLPAAIAVKGSVPRSAATGGGSANLHMRKKCRGRLELDIPRTSRNLARRGEDSGTSFCRPNVGIRRWVASCGRTGEQGARHDRQGHCLVETLSQRTPEIRSGRGRNIGLADRHERGRLRGSLRQRRRAAFGAVCRDLHIREIKTSSRSSPISCRSSLERNVLAPPNLSALSFQRPDFMPEFPQALADRTRAP